MTDDDGSRVLRRLTMLMYFERVTRRVFPEERWTNLGSLMDPERDAREFVNSELHEDPLEFREWVVAEYLRWVRFRGEHEAAKGFCWCARSYLLHGMDFPDAEYGSGAT